MPTMPPALEERLAAARLSLMFERPYFTTAVSNLQFVYEPRLVGPDGRPVIAGVDDYWRCYVNDAGVDGFLLTAPIPQVVFVLLHELMHLLGEHGERQRVLGADEARFNYAGDLSINSALKGQANEKLQVVEWALYPENMRPTMPDFLMTEEYLALLPERPKCEDGPGGRKPGPGEGGTAAGGCGSGAGGKKGDWELGPPGTDKGDPRTAAAPGLDKLGAELVRQTTAQEIQKAAQDEKLRGTIPAGMERWAHRVLNPQVDWRQHVAGAVSGGYAEVAGRVNYTMSRPSRRSSATPGIFLPGLRMPIPHVVEIIDTSGSMSEDDLAAALAESHGLLKATGGKITVMCVDAAVAGVQKITSAAAIVLKGGGGTDMRVAFAAAEALRPKADMAVLFTDMGTPWPDEKPDIKTIVVVAIGEYGEPPDWAKNRFVRILPVAAEPAGAAA